MDVTECIKNRRSIRKFKNEPLSDEIFMQLAAAASCAPSWKNSQTTRYIVISDAALKRRLAKTCVLDFEYNKKTILNAPALVLVTTVANRSGYERDGSFSTGKGTHWESFDAGIATQTFCLAAHSMGLGTVVLGIFDHEKVIETAGVPEGQKVSAMVAIGCPDEMPPMPKRKCAEELLSFRRMPEDAAAKDTQ